MELKITHEGLINGFGKIIDIPNDYLYPMYKSSDIAQVILKPPKRMMIITQHKIGDDTSNFSKISPRTWNYLIANAYKLDARKSSIYKNLLALLFLEWEIILLSLGKLLYLVFIKILSSRK